MSEHPELTELSDEDGFRFDVILRMTGEVVNAILDRREPMTEDDVYMVATRIQEVQFVLDDLISGLEDE